MVPTLYVQVQYMHRLITLVVRSGSRLTGGGCYLVIAAVLVAIAGQGQVSTRKRNLNQRGQNSYSDFRRFLYRFCPREWLKTYSSHQDHLSHHLSSNFLLQGFANCCFFLHFLQCSSRLST